ncbi:MAG: DUF1571 domain-containing protein [Isosphaerales bacterium]
MTERCRGGVESNTGWTRWIFLSNVVALTVAVDAGEDRSPANPASTTRTPKSVSNAGGGGVASPAAAGRTATGSRSASHQPAAPERVAVADQSTGARLVLKPSAAPVSVSSSLETPITRAIRTIADCQARYHAVEDYTCTFFKRERIGGRLTPVHIMALKIRTNPQSIYLKFQQPARGREAIYVSGRHGGKLLAHDVGLNKLLAGTLQLEPTGARAMEDCRHPITEAGIGPLLATLSKRWAVELDPAESVITFRDDMVIDTRQCTMIESTHPHRQPEFLHHKVRVFIDQEIGLPIRFEAYDWPKHPNSEPDLQEEYTYLNLKLNVGLKDLDFEASNTAYSFGRF